MFGTINFKINGKLPDRLGQRLVDSRLNALEAGIKLHRVLPQNSAPQADKNHKVDKAGTLETSIHLILEQTSINSQTLIPDSQSNTPHSSQSNTPNLSQSNSSPPSPSSGPACLSDAFIVNVQANKYIMRNQLWDLYHGTITSGDGNEKSVLIQITSTLPFPIERPRVLPNFGYGLERFSKFDVALMVQREQSFYQEFHEELQDVIPNFIGLYKMPLPDHSITHSQPGCLYVMLLEDPGEPVTTMNFPLVDDFAGPLVWSRVYQLYDDFHRLGFCHNTELLGGNVFYDKMTDTFKLINLRAAFHIMYSPWSKARVDAMLKQEVEKVHFYEMCNKRLMETEDSSKSLNL